MGRLSTTTFDYIIAIGLLFCCVQIQISTCSDSPEPRKKSGPPDDPLPGPIPGYLGPLAHRLGGNDDAEGEGDDGESESESESGNHSVVAINARPAKSGGPPTSVEVIVETPPVPPDPALAPPPLVIVGDPLPPLTGQLSYRSRPLTGPRLFPYHEKVAYSQAYNDKPVGPYKVPLTAAASEKHTSVSQIQHISISVPAQIESKPVYPAAEKLIHEKTVQQLVSHPVQPIRYPPASHDEVLLGNQVVSVYSPPQLIPPRPAYPVVAERVTNTNQIIAVPAPVYPAPPNQQVSVVKEVHVISAPVPPQPVYPSPHPVVIDKHIQVVPGTFSNRYPVQDKAVPGAQQLQSTSIVNQIYPIQDYPRPNPYNHSPGSTIVNKQINTVFPVDSPGSKPPYPQQTNTAFNTVTSYSQTNSHPTQSGYNIVTPSLIPNSPHHTKYRIADIFSPLIGSLVPSPHELKPLQPVNNSGYSPYIDSVAVSQAQNNNVIFPPPAEGPVSPSAVITNHHSFSYRPTDNHVAPNYGPPSVYPTPNYPYPSPTPYDPSRYPAPVPQASPYEQPFNPHGHPYPQHYPHPDPHYSQRVHQSVHINHNEIAISQLGYISPVCSRDTGIPYCLSDPEYPIAEINAYIAMYPEKYQLLRPMVSWKIIHQTSHQSTSGAANQSPVEPGTATTPPAEAAEPTPPASVPTGLDQNTAGIHNSSSGSMCASHINPSAKLLRAMNEHNKWKCIVHLPEAHQTSSVDICDNNRTSCRHVDPRVHTQCVQEFVLQQMMVFSPEFGLHLDDLKVPRGCRCRIADPVYPGPVPTAGSFHAKPFLR